MHDLLVRVGLPAAPVLEQGERSPGIDPGSVYARIADPLVGDLPRFGTTADFFIGEGRGFVGWSHARRRASRTPYGPSPLARGGVAESEPTLRVFGGLHWVYDDRYLVEGRWTPGQKMGFEGGLAASVARSGDAVRVHGSVSAGCDSDDRRWVRATAAFKGSVSPSESFELRTRLFGGIAIGPDPDPGSQWDGRFVPRERLFFLAGGGPFEAYSNPWVRSHGAPLAEGGWVAGGGELRGFHPGVALAELAAATATALDPESPCLWATEHGPRVPSRLPGSPLAGPFSSRAIPPYSSCRSRRSARTPTSIGARAPGSRSVYPVHPSGSSWPFRSLRLDQSSRRWAATRRWPSAGRWECRAPHASDLVW